MSLTSSLLDFCKNYLEHHRVLVLHSFAWMFFLKFTKPFLHAVQLLNAQVLAIHMSGLCRLKSFGIYKSIKTRSISKSSNIDRMLNILLSLIPHAFLKQRTAHTNKDCTTVSQCAIIFSYSHESEEEVLHIIVMLWNKTHGKDVH